MDGMQTLPAEEVLDLPTAKALQQGINKVHVHSLHIDYMYIYNFINPFLRNNPIL